MAEEEKEEDLSDLLDGDDFITEEERREREANRQRLERKRRLESLQNSNNVSSPPPPPPTLPTSPPSKKYIETASKTDDIVNKLNSNEEKPAQQEESENDNEKEKKNSDDSGDDDDDFDMFSSSVSTIVADTNNTDYSAATKKSKAAAASAEGGSQQDWDDSEGYYKTVIGEVITLDTTKNTDDNDDDNRHNVHGDTTKSMVPVGDISFRVSGVIGKGVFSSVLKCTTISNSTSTMLPPVVAIKCIRNNDIMAKSASNEIQFLQRLNKQSQGIIPLLLPTSSTPLEHRGHVLLVFPCADANLREVLSKFGKGVGLSLQAVRSYFGQLISGASHMKKHMIIHSDIKPDNILVSQNYSIVQLSDLGSALDVSSSGQQQQPTPYLVSRFYRAPEIILGLIPTFAIDLWSLAVSVAELFLGDVLFSGKTNNDMIYTFMQHLGSFSNRLIRQHLVQCSKMPIPAHFTQRTEGTGSDYLFKQHTQDPVTGKPVNRYISLFSSAGASGGGDSRHEVFPSTPLSKKLLKAKSSNDSRIMVQRFSDLLQKCLTLDPSRRISLKDALAHDFFTKAATTTTPSTAAAAAAAAKNNGNG